MLVGLDLELCPTSASGTQSRQAPDVKSRGYRSFRVAGDLNMDSAPGDPALPTAAPAALLSQTMMELALLLSPSQKLAALLLMPPSTPLSRPQPTQLDFSGLSA